MKKPLRASLNLAGALIATVGTVYISAYGLGPLPPLGPVLNPGTGVWKIAQDAQLPHSQTLRISGLLHPVQITFDANGAASIHALDDHDLFLAMGYLHATYRLFQMDLMRRQGSGQLSAIVGKKALPSDEFELQLGLQRTAVKEWNNMLANDPARQALLAYASGVNERIQQDERSGNLPFMFKLLNYRPARWTPVDSLVIQGDMTQTLDFTEDPLDYALLVKSLGYTRTMDWFPIVPSDTQHPYDLGPYKSGGVAPMSSQSATSISNAEIVATRSIEAKLRSLPSSAIHHGSNSNNWAVDGTKTASGKPLMAGDPHLSQTLPAIWYQVAGDSPGYHFSGVSIPGVPVILIGHNQNISWSLTNVQNQATFYYQEKTSPSHPNEYYWQGAWRRIQSIAYTIPLKGGKSVHFFVHLTVHGPIITDKGQTMSVDWIGSLPSPDLDALLQITQSKNFSAFRSALQNWHAPSQNFVYADKKGNIGLISAGYYPVFKAGKPWLPMSGTGADDIIGTIPYADIPQAYDPPDHIVFSANQREVAGNYPYYIGTSKDFFDNGYRADEIYQVLSRSSKLTTADMEKLQNNTTDYLATLIVPRLLTALQGQSLSNTSQSAMKALRNWNESMSASSSSATIWWVFLSNYLQDTFGPWWQAKSVPVSLDANLQLNPSQTSLVEDLEAWTLKDPNNSAFNLPDGTARRAPDVMRLAFSQTVTQLSDKFGSNVSSWSWGKLHTREFTSLAQIPAFGYGPKPSGGDMWTVDAADSDNGYLSTAGPSWRFVMNWGNGKGVGVYPGGQSENPVSTWYENLVSAWWSGSYNAMPAIGATKGVSWSLIPSSQ